MARLSVIKNIKKIDNRILSMLSLTLTLARFARWNSHSGREYDANSFQQLPL